MSAFFSFDVEGRPVFELMGRKEGMRKKERQKVTIT